MSSKYINARLLQSIVTRLGMTIHSSGSNKQIYNLDDRIRTFILDDVRNITLYCNLYNRIDLELKQIEGYFYYKIVSQHFMFEFVTGRLTIRYVRSCINTTFKLNTPDDSLIAKILNTKYRNDFINYISSKASRLSIHLLDPDQTRDFIYSDLHIASMESGKIVNMEVKSISVPLNHITVDVKTGNLVFKSYTLIDLRIVIEPKDLYEVEQTLLRDDLELFEIYNLFEKIKLDCFVIM